MGLIVGVEQRIDRSLKRLGELPRRVIRTYLTRDQRIGDGYRRIYHYHIRKAAGTSTNWAMLALAGDGKAIYEQLSLAPDHCVVSGGKVFVGWNKTLIERGDYLYAFSHAPAHQLSLPERTFTFTCFRDPVDRVVSHYKMLRDYVEGGGHHPGMEPEKAWLGSGFDDFVRNMPKEHLMNQLYMFSSRLDVEEALENVNQCSYWFFVDAYKEGMRELSRLIDLPITPLHVRTTAHPPDIAPGTVEYLQKALGPEIEFYRRLRQIKNSMNPATVHQG